MATRSPGRMRMKFFRIRPETCANTWCLFSSSTLNIAFGRVSTTTAITSIASSFDKRSPLERWEAKPLCFHNFCLGWSLRLQAEVPCCTLVHTAPSIVPQNGSIFLACQHLGAIFCDGYGVLEVGAVTAVDCDGCPTVLEDTDFRAAGVDHGLDGENHAGLEAGALAGWAEVGDLGVLVHGTADAMADKLADDAEALGLAVLLDCGGDIAETPTHLALLDGFFEGGLGDFEEFAGLRADLSDGVGHGGVGVVAVDDDATVDGEDVALFEDAFGVGNAVDDLVVDGGAE